MKGMAIRGWRTNGQIVERILRLRMNKGKKCDSNISKTFQMDGQRRDY